MTENVGTEWLDSINRVVAEKDAEIARLNNVVTEQTTRARAAKVELTALRDNIKAFIIDAVEEGEDKDFLRSLAEVAGIEVRTEVTKRITIEAEVEIEVDIFDDVDYYNFDFTITYEGDELHVRDSNIDVQD